MSVAVAVPGGTGVEFGLIALRTRNIARTAVAIGSLSLAFIYVAPIAAAIVATPPPRVHALDSLTLPTLRFPVLRTRVAPTAHVAATSAPTQFFHARHGAPTAATHRFLIHTGAIVMRRNWVPPVPVVTNSYGPALHAPAAQKTKPTAAQPTPVTSSVGSEPTAFGADTTPAVTALPAAAPAATEPATQVPASVETTTAPSAPTSDYGSVDPASSDASDASMVVSQRPTW